MKKPHLSSLNIQYVLLEQGNYRYVWLAGVVGEVSTMANPTQPNTMLNRLERNSEIHQGQVVASGRCFGTARNATGCRTCSLRTI